MRDVSSTFALSTESRLPRRPRASSKARRATRSTCVRRVLARVEDRAVVARAAARRSRGRPRARGRSAGRSRPRSPGGGSRTRRARCRSRSGPASGRTRRRPTSARRPRRAAPRRPAARSERLGRERDPVRVDRGTAERRSSISTSSASASSTRTASAITSGPIPSPGRQTTLPAPWISPRVRSRTKRWKSRERVRRERAGVHRPRRAGEHRVLAVVVAQGDLLRRACSRAATFTISSRRLMSVDERAVDLA